MSGKKHFKNCAVTLGKSYKSWEFALAVALLAVTASFAIGGQILLTVAGVVALYVYCVHVLYTIPEFSFAVISRLQMVKPGVRLDGLGARIPGDEVHVIRRNPVNVVISFERQLKDNRVARGKIRVTMRPDPRIGDQRGINRYAAWVLQERWGLEKAGYAEHHVQEAIEAPLKSLLYSVLGSVDSVQLDKSLHGLALFIESEVGVHKPLHRDVDFLRKVQGCADGDPDPVEPSVSEILEWYTKHHRMVSERLRELDQEFEDEPGVELNPDHVSHGEAHTSTTLEEVAIVEFGYDTVTTAAGTAQFSAKTIQEVQASITKDLINSGVDPNTAAIIAAGMVRAAEVKGNVITGDKNTRSAAAAGGAFGDAARGGGT